MPNSDDQDQRTVDPAAQDQSQTVKLGETEYTLEQLAEAVKDHENIKDWRRDLNEKGRELNEQRRQMEVGLAEIRSTKELLEKFANSPQTIAPKRKDWREVEDPGEKLALALEDLDEWKNKYEEKLIKIENERKETSKQEQQRKLAEYWDETVTTAIDKYALDGNDLDRELLEGYVSKKMLELGVDRWSPEAVDDFATKGRELIDKLGTAKVSDYVEGKNQDRKRKVNTPGSPPAPSAKRFSHKMNQRERLAMMEDDPNA